MVKRFLFTLIALLWTAAAFAQTFPKPPDVPAYSAVAPLYKTDGTANVVIDSTVTPMPIGTGLANIPIPSTTNRIISNGPYDGTASPFCKTIPYGGTCNENKFRTIGGVTTLLPDDPERNYGQPGASHPHEFFAGASCNAYSTYAGLRQHALDSAAAGTDVNGTCYWFPPFIVTNPYGDGKNFAIRADSTTIYYVDETNGNGNGDTAKAHYPVGLRWVGGFEMDASSQTTQYAWLQTVLDAANTAQGYTRYTLKNPSGHYQTQASFSCVGASPASTYVVKNADGTDPFNGTCVAGGGVGNTGDFYVVFDGPQCYDGTNLWSPGSYKHFIPGVWDTVKNGWACPYNYYRLLSLRLEIHYTQNGWSDRQRWDLSSDMAYRMKYGLTQAQLPPGTTFHTDWMDGWDHNIFNIAQEQCGGVEHNTGHECNSSQYDSSHYLKGGQSGESGAGGRNPQVDSTSKAHTLETDPGWLLVAPSWSGGMTNLKVCHGTSPC